MLSHSPTQQNGSVAQTFAAQGSQVAVSEPPVSQVAWVQAAHTPQSCGQFAQLSPAAPVQTPSPQALRQVPQSCGQVLQLSLPLQTPSPQTTQAPQSPGHDEHVSYGWVHVVSPQTGVGQVLPHRFRAVALQAGVQLVVQHDGFCAQNTVLQAGHDASAF